MRRQSALLTIFALVVTPFAGLFTTQAAQVTAYTDLTGQPATAPSTIAAAPEVNASTADEFFYSYLASATEFAAANTVSVYVPAGFTAVANCGTPTTDADGDVTPDGALVVSGDTVVGWTLTYTFTAATASAVTTGVEFCFAATTPAANGNYAISSADTNDSDSSAALVYVGTTAAADTNDVTVNAVVPVTLTLRIKSPTTLLNTNTCDLGVLNAASVNTCSYRIAAGTNLTNGMRVRALTDAELDSGANTINNVADGAVTAGSEEHGVTLTAGAGWTLTSPFDAGDDAITTTEAELFDRATAVDDTVAGNWTTVTHRASINSATAAGAYNQVVTYRAYALP